MLRCALVDLATLPSYGEQNKTNSTVLSSYIFIRKCSSTSKKRHIIKLKTNLFHRTLNAMITNFIWLKTQGHIMMQSYYSIY